MNSRTSAIIALLTTITFLAIKLAISSEFTIGEFIWQDIIAVSAILFLAKEIGAVEIKDEQPILITVNNEINKKQIDEMNFETTEEAKSNVDLSSKMVELLDVLANKITQVEQKLERKPEFTSQLNNLSVQKSCIPAETKKFHTEKIYKTRNKRRETFHNKKILATAEEPIVNPMIQSSKGSMLQSIFKENEKLQKKAS